MRRTFALPMEAEIRLDIGDQGKGAGGALSITSPTLKETFGQCSRRPWGILGLLVGASNPSKSNPRDGNSQTPRTCPASKKQPRPDPDTPQRSSGNILFGWLVLPKYTNSVQQKPTLVTASSTHEAMALILPIINLFDPPETFYHLPIG